MRTTFCGDKDCDAPATISHSVEVDGVDFDGQLKLFSQQRVVCARGHHYDRIVDWDPDDEDWGDPAYD